MSQLIRHQVTFELIWNWWKTCLLVKTADLEFCPKDDTTRNAACNANHQTLSDTNGAITCSITAHQNESRENSSGSLSMHPDAQNSLLGKTPNTSAFWICISGYTTLWTSISVNCSNDSVSNLYTEIGNLFFFSSGLNDRRLKTKK